MTPETDVPEDSRSFPKVPDVPGCPCVLCACVLLFLHCIMSSCHHVIFYFLHLNLNKPCGPSVHLNRGKIVFSLKHIKVSHYLGSYIKNIPLFGITVTHLYIFPHVFSLRVSSSKTLPVIPFRCSEVLPKTLQHFY